MAGLACEPVNEVSFNSKWVCSGDKSLNSPSSFTNQTISMIKILGTVIALVCSALAVSICFSTPPQGSNCNDVLNALKQRQGDKQDVHASNVLDRKEFFEEARRKRAMKLEEDNKKKRETDKRRSEKRALKEKQEKKKAEETKKKQEDQKQLREAELVKRQATQKQEVSVQKQKSMEVAASLTADEQKPGSDVGDGTRVTINFQCQNASKFCLQLDLTKTTVGLLRERLGKLTGSPPEDHVLIFMGQMMKDDDRALVSFKLSENQCIHLLVRGSKVSAVEIQQAMDGEIEQTQS
jgi:hypothetical protein